MYIYLIKKKKKENIGIEVIYNFSSYTLHFQKVSLKDFCSSNFLLV